MIINIPMEQQEGSENGGSGGGPKATSMMSKKRYHQIEEALAELIQDEDVVQKALERIRGIMNFDPQQKKYNERVNGYIKTYRMKQKEKKQTD